MTTLVDTSALLACLDAADSHHRTAVDWLSGPGHDAAETLLTHNYVVVESTALVQRRLGLRAVRVLLEDLVRTLDVEFVDQSLHGAATSALLASGGGGPSLVDHVSFELMRRRRIPQAFAFDRDFRAAGFVTVP